MTGPRPKIGNTTIQAAQKVLAAAAKQSVGQIPVEKRGAKYLKTLAGVVLFVAAWFVPTLGFPQAAAYVLATFGGFIASQELVTKFAAFVPGVIRETRKALKGES